MHLQNKETFSFVIVLEQQLNENISSFFKIISFFCSTINFPIFIEGGAKAIRKKNKCWRKKEVIQQNSTSDIQYPKHGGDKGTIVIQIIINIIRKWK